MKDINLKKDDIIKLKFTDEDPWSNVRILGRAVKRSTNRSDTNWFNVQNLILVQESCINLNSTSKWKKILSFANTHRLDDLISAKNDRK